MQPTVELSIVVRNQWENTKRLLDSLFERTKYSNYKITIIDNASTDITVNELEEYKDKANIIWNETRKSFAACHNMVMSKTPCNYVCLLSSDVELTDSWLTKLVEYSEKDSKLGIVAPAKLIENRKLLGGSLKNNAGWVNIFEGDKEDIEWLHSCCLLVRLAVIRRIEVLDERFKNKYYEEVDFCIRAIEAGFKVECFRDCVVDYYDDEYPDWKTNQEINRTIFVDKHEDWLIERKGKAIKKLRRPKPNVIKQMQKKFGA